MTGTELVQHTHTMTVTYYGIQGPLTKREYEYKLWEQATLAYMPDYIPEDKDDMMDYESIDVV